MLALLDRLKSVLADFAAREEKLSGELRTRIGAETKAHETAVEQQAAELAERIAAAETVFETEKKIKQTKFERRKARISQALIITSRQVMEGNDRSGRRQKGLQRSAQDAERNRDADLTAIAARLEDFRNQAGRKLRGFRSTGNGGQPAPFAVTAPSAGCFPRSSKWPELSLPPAENQLFEELRQLETKTLDELRRFEKIPLPRVFKFLPVWLLTILLLLAFGAAAALLHNQGYTSDSYWKTGVALVAAWVVILVIHQLGKRRGAPSANTIAGNLARARRLHDGSLDRAELQYAQDQERIQKEFETTSRNLNQAMEANPKGGLGDARQPGPEGR